MAIVSTNQFVKFVRGSQDAWNLLLHKEPDTLYFIVNSGESTGKLYLGDKLISGGASVEDLADLGIVITDAEEGQVLAYNATTGNWENTDINGLLDIDEMYGATSEEDGITGLVPVPHAGDQNLFLRGDATWANPVSADAIKEAIGISAAEPGNLLQLGENNELSWVAPADLGFYTKDETDAAIADAVAGLVGVQFETVEELPSEGENGKIYLVPSADPLTGDNYTEYIYVNNEWEKVGETGEINLTNYVTNDALEIALNDYAKTSDLNDYVTKAEVGDLSQLIVSNESITTLVGQVNDNTERLTWHEMT